MDSIVNMQSIVKEQKALGLAANQVGMKERIIIVSFDGEQVPMLNPRITSATDEKTGEEGCLSFPGVFVNIKRFSRITVEWEDVNLKTHCETFIDMAAVIVQHEIDHLDGLTIYQRAGQTTKTMIIRTLKKGKRLHYRNEEKATIMKNKIKEIDRVNEIIKEVNEKD